MMKGTHKNAELARKYFAHFMADEIPAMLDMHTDDVEWNIGLGAAAGVVPYFGKFRGRDGCMKCLEKYAQSVAPQEFELTGYYGDADKAFVTGHEKVRVKSTGKTFETSFVFVLAFRKGKVASLTAFIDTAALAKAFSRG